ncbi:uncharacterized protein LOC109858672 [Pseudomyrmex gracilis]|uniref:uncharacterized protein LOC109858672 n=1 Tax=Pseudomyrmex gracilis TaxID=219809 RepID=UPI000994DC33|nr:uncharacterized protein LOC109858672 [Pseudomyrmex gracilis]
MFQFLPKILDLVLPLNRSRPCQLLVIAEYFVNKEKYLYAMILHELVTFYIGINALIGVGTMMMVYIIHACAMFKIARFLNYLQSLCHMAYGILVVVGVCSLIINLVQFFQVIMTNNIGEIFTFGLLIVLHVNYMFIGSYGGQQIIDHGIHFFRSSYNGMWYAAPLHAQKLLLFVMQKGMVNVNLTAAGLFIASFECFATVEDHYYTINKHCLKVLGIWPHDKSRLIMLQRALISLLIMSYIGMQLLLFTTTEYSMELFLRVLSLSFVFVVIAVHYFTSILKEKDIINLHQQIREDWNLMCDKIENDIMRQNAHNGQIFIQLLFLILVFALVGAVILQFIPIIFDVVFPLDNPRPRNLLIMAEYFVFTNDHFYIKVLHELVSVTVSFTIGYATATQLLGFIYHIFGMFKIARFTKTLETSFDKPLSILAFLGVSLLSLNLYGVINVALSYATLLYNCQSKE